MTESLNLQMYNAFLNCRMYCYGSRQVHIVLLYRVWSWDHLLGCWSCFCQFCFEADNYNDCHAYFHTKFMIRFSTSTSVGLQLGASENASSFPSYQVPAAVAFAVVQLQSLAHPPATSETVPCIWDSNSFQLSPLMQLFEQLQDALCVLVCVSVCALSARFAQTWSRLLRK